MIYRVKCGLAIVLALAAALPTYGGESAPTDGFVPSADLPEGWYARIETGLGRIVARLLPEQAPQAVAHFAALADGRLEWFDAISGKVMKGPYYDGVRVHSADAGRFFEAGDRYGTGDGAPRIYAPPEGFGPINFNHPGRLGLTRLTGGRISGVLFFVTASGVPWLSSDHPCFGTVVSGREVALALSEVKVNSNNRPLEPQFIDKIRIFSVGHPPPLPEPVPYEPKLQQIRKKEDPPTAP